MASIRNGLGKTRYGTYRYGVPLMGIPQRNIYVNDSNARIIDPATGDLQDGTEPIASVATIRPGEGPYNGPALAIEEETTNLFYDTDFSDVESNGYESAVITRTAGQPDPDGGNNAVRIQTSGGTSTLKFYYSVSGFLTGDPQSNSVWIKNNSGCEVILGLNGFITAYPNGFSGWATCEWASRTNGTSHFQIRARTISDNLDIIVYHPQVEKKSFATSYTPYGTPRAAGQHRFAASTFPTGDFTITIRYKGYAGAANTQRTLFGKWGDSDHRDFVLQIKDDNYLRFIYGKTGTSCTYFDTDSAPLNDYSQQFNNIFLVYTSSTSTVDIWVAGEIVKSSLITGYTPKATDWGWGTRAGQGGGTDYPANGLFDAQCMAVIPRALSDKEIKSVYYSHKITQNT